jgi:hypothetical protein
MIAIAVATIAVPAAIYAATTGVSPLWVVTWTTWWSRGGDICCHHWCVPVGRVATSAISTTAGSAAIMCPYLSLDWPWVYQ